MISLFHVHSMSISYRQYHTDTGQYTLPKQSSTGSHSVNQSIYQSSNLGAEGPLMQEVFRTGLTRHSNVYLILQ